MGRAARSRRRALAACKDTRELKQHKKTSRSPHGAHKWVRTRKSRPTVRPRLWLKATPPARRKTSPQSVLTNQLSADCRDAAAPKSRSALRHKTTAKTKKKPWPRKSPTTAGR